MYIKTDELEKLKKYLRATNYLSIAQMYLLDNPLLRRNLKLEDIKKKVVGHFGTVPGQNFIYLHLNRIIKKYDLNMIYISGPGHGGNSLVSNTYIEGTYSKIYPEITYDLEGLTKLCKRFSFPKGISSHASPEVPGSIHEGGELGYSLSHAYGAVLDNPDLIVACIVGDGEAETGPLAASWQLNKIINYKEDGIVLPILHLNGYKIANPTILSRINEEELIKYFEGCGYIPFIVSGTSEDVLHNKMAFVLDNVIDNIKKYKKGLITKLPLIILKTKKGWTGPKEYKNTKIENSFHSHQVPITIDNEESLKALESWLQSYHPEELFNEKGTVIDEIKDLIPNPGQKMSENKNANGGHLLKNLIIPNYEEYAIEVVKKGEVLAQDTEVLSIFLRDIIKNNPNNFRLFCPDEALSNRLNHIFEVTKRQWNTSINDNDELLSPKGRVIDSILSEHLCEGMLEGYLLTGRHGIFSSYEAFTRIVDSMASQHAKWIKITKELNWRKEIASLNYLLTSHVWQQDHNGYTHQDPGFLNHLATKKSEIVRIYLPPDANTLLSCTSHILQTKNYINVIVASKHPHFQWLNINEAKLHCEKGIGIWEFASNCEENPDIIMASCGDTPTIETLAAISILREYLPNIKIKMINIVDLMKLSNKHPHGLSDEEYDKLFTIDKPIIFNFHGYPNLIHELTYNRHNNNLHVHGYQEEGTITTPFDMRVQNKIDRYNLVIDSLKYLQVNQIRKDIIKNLCEEKLLYHNDYIGKYGIDIPEIINWRWNNWK